MGPGNHTKHQKLLECVLTGNSKLYLGKVYTEEQLAKLSEEEVEKLFNNYEAKLSGQMVKSLGKSIINMYSMGACSALKITNQEALSEDLENDPFLNSALQRFTCELYYRFSSFLAPLSIGITMSRHYLFIFIGMGMAGFFFGIGLMLAVKTVNNLECCINRKCL